MIIGKKYSGPCIVHITSSVPLPETAVHDVYDGLCDYFSFSFTRDKNKYENNTSQSHIVIKQEKKG